MALDHLKLGPAATGVHKVRVPGTNTALFDYALTILGSWALAALTKLPLVFVTVVLFILGSLLHYLLGVQTQIWSWLGVKVLKK
jgi:hypothetical protein